MRDLTGILGLGISGLAAFELLKKQNKNIVVFDDKIKPNLKLKKYWKNYQRRVIFIHSSIKESYYFKISRSRNLT